MGYGNWSTCALEYPSKVTYTQDLHIGTIAVTTATWCTRDFITHHTIPDEDVEEVKEMFDKSDNEYYVTKF